MNTGVAGVTPKSSPLKRTCTARRHADAIEQRPQGIPVHNALPIAPLPHWPPARAAKKARQLPEHWFTAASSTGSGRRRIR